MARKVGGRGGQGWLLEEPSLAEAVAWYGEHVLAAKDNAGTRRTYGWILQWWVKNLPAHPVGADVTEFLTEQVRLKTESGGAEGINRNTARTRKTVLSVALQAARERWRLLNDFTQQSARIKAEPEAPRGMADPLTTFPLILAAMPDAQARAFVRFQRECGLRVGEVRGVEPKHVNNARAEVAILQQRDINRCEPAPLKTDTSAATIPVDPSLLEELRQATRDNMRAGHRQTTARRTFLFPYYRLDQDRLMADVRRVAASDFPEDSAWHVFRHTFGTEAVDAFGEHVEKVKGLMRHKNIRTTSTYIGTIRGNYFPANDMRALTARRNAEVAARAAGPEVGRHLEVEPSTRRTNPVAASTGTSAATIERESGQ